MNKLSGRRESAFGEECVCVCVSVCGVCCVVCVCVLRGFLFQRNTDRTGGEPRRDPADDPGSFRGCPPMPRCNTANVRRGSSYDQAAIVCTF